MAGKIRVYEGEKVEIAYDAKRCIHAAECVTRLRSVFDNGKRPWIDPNGAPVEQVASTIHLCPSGALHYTSKDGSIAETPQPVNTVHVEPHGPLYVRGTLVLTDADGNPVEHETRTALCRCGASNNKPFCDNSHLNINFEAAVDQTREAVEPLTDGGELTIKPGLNGSYTFSGQFTVYDETGKPIYAGEKQWLCRCGGSANKPFCDGTHKRIGFLSEPPPPADNPPA